MNINAKSANRLLFPVMLAYVRWTQYQENDNTACYQVQNKPFRPPQTKHSFRVREDALSWHKSLYQLFWSYQIRIFGGENPNEFRSAPGPTHRDGCYSASTLLFPQHPTAPDSAFGSQNSILHLFRAGDVWEDWGSCASVGLLHTVFHTSQASKGNTPESLKDGHMLWVPVSEVTSDLPDFWRWTNLPSLFYSRHEAGILFRHLPLTTCC